MNQKATLIAAVAVCSTAGFMVGRISSDTATSTSDGERPMGPRTGNSSSMRSGSQVGPRASGQSSARHRSPTSRSGGSVDSQDPIARMESIINNPDPFERAEQWMKFVKGLDSSEVEDVIVSFRGKGLASDNLRGQGLASDNFSEYSMLLTAWAKYDPLAALDYAKKNTSTGFARQTILTSWATTDPIGAIRWAEDNKPSIGENLWMVGVIRGIAASDPARATELMNSMHDSIERGHALTAVMGQYLKQGPEAARAWALSIEDEQLRAGAISRIADNLARTDPQGTANWLLANPGEGATQAMHDVMVHMVNQDPQAAIAYLNKITEEGLKQRALQGITDQLAKSDPEAALTLMDSNAAYVTDDVVEEFVESVRRSDPALGASQISRIQDEGTRDHAYRIYMWRWMRDDMEGATTWANQNLPPENVQRYMSRERELFEGVRGVEVEADTTEMDYFIDLRSILKLNVVEH